MVIEENADAQDITSDEEETGEDKTSDESEEDESQNEDTPKRSDIAQKIKYRERAKKAEQEVVTLKAEFEKLKNLVAKPTSEQEQKAQEYIRGEARRVYEELKKAEQEQKESERRDFEEKVETVLENNPDVTEEELLEVIEELDVEPEIAIKVLKRQGVKKEKPKMPQAKRASPIPLKEKKDDTGKSLFEIAREEAQKLKNKE